MRTIKTTSGAPIPLDGDLLAVMEAQPAAQREPPHQSVLRDLPFGRHLGLRLQLRIPGEQRFVDHQTADGGNTRGTKHRVQQHDVVLRHDPQHFGFGTGKRDESDHAYCGHDKAAKQKIAMPHGLASQ